MILLSKNFCFLLFFENFCHVIGSFFFVFLTWITYDPYITWKNCTKILGSKTILRASEVNVLPFSSNALFLHWNLKPSMRVPKLYVFWTYSSENEIFCKFLEDQNHKSHFVPKNQKFGNRQTQTDKVFQKKHIFRF